MNCAAKSDLLPAYAVSLAVHGIAFALFNSGLPISSPSRLTGRPVNTDKDIAVLVTSRPPLHDGKQRGEMPLPEKPGASVQSSIKPAEGPARQLTSSFSPAQKPMPQRTNRKRKDPPAKKLVKKALRHRPNSETDNSRAGEEKAPVQALPASNKSPTKVARQRGQYRTIGEPMLSAYSPARLKPEPVPAPALPTPIRTRQPVYPEEARWEERTGKVTVKFRLSTQGTVVTPGIEKSSGHRDLDVAAIQAIQLWRFNIQGSHQSAQWYYYAFRFELN